VLLAAQNHHPGSALRQRTRAADDAVESVGEPGAAAKWPVPALMDMLRVEENEAGRRQRGAV